ncbi:hypothetical protein DL89DRAFT_75947 [Linderina pennispora]|uniref:Uncharacterized protein n=1 Tax=Linderina pennispora TaxID=61395 RepID=A0A1Y1VXP2_9FUNG|nr:uncharacterized protein DL89DRAFT_75947 [Linderina pennispora]ORX66049.1 hypothetical protein DL89DRAFT_75947 [Linderina pennispora]
MALALLPPSLVRPPCQPRTRAARCLFAASNTSSGIRLTPQKTSLSLLSLGVSGGLHAHGLYSGSSSSSSLASAKQEWLSNTHKLRQRIGERGVNRTSGEVKDGLVASALTSRSAQAAQCWLRSAVGNADARLSDLEEQPQAGALRANPRRPQRILRPGHGSLSPTALRRLSGTTSNRWTLRARKSAANHRLCRRWRYAVHARPKLPRTVCALQSHRGITRPAAGCSAASRWMMLALCWRWTR